MNLNIVYTLSSERKRLDFTLSRLDFYKEKGHDIRLPADIALPKVDKDEAYKQLEQEYRDSDLIVIKDNLFRDWHTHQVSIMEYFDSLPFKKPEDVTLTLTQYGTGGSYNANTNEIIVNVRHSNDLLSILVHEITHLIVEKSIVEKFKLTHEEKENLIKWLLSSSAALREFISVPRRMPIELPDSSVIEELTARGYVARNKGNKSLTS